MRTSLVLTIASVPLLLWTGVAAATDIGKAVELCDKNPNCTKHPGGAGGLDLNVKTSQGDKTIRCPITGPCVVLLTTSSGGNTQGSGKGSSGNVDSVLATPGSPKGGVAPANMLETSPGLSQQGPSGMGSPGSAPAAPKGPSFR